MTKIIVSDRYMEILRNSWNYVGLMGLSVGKVGFGDKETMKAYSEFMHERFPKSYFLIADLPKKYNIMAIEGVDENEAIRRVNIAGEDMARFITGCAKEFPEIEVKRWNDFAIHPLYLKNLALLKGNYERDKLRVELRNMTHYKLLDTNFTQECNYLVWAFLSNQFGNPRMNNSIDLGRRTEICLNYLFEELAMLLALPVILGQPVCEIYPCRNELQERLQEKVFTFSKDLSMRDDRRFMEVYYGPQN